MLKSVPTINDDKLLDLLVNRLKRAMVATIIVEHERQGETGLECL